MLLLFLIFELLSIYFYMKGGPLGPLFFVFNVFFVLLKGNNNQYRLLALLIMSLPFSFIGIMGIEMVHVLSWYNLFLIFFIIYNLPKFTLSSSAGGGILVVFFCLFISTSWAYDTAKAWTEICQIMVMLLPTTLVFCSRRKMLISSADINKLVALYGHVAFCTAVGMLIQYYYILQGNQIGIINFTGGGRISCYCLFRGASILPIYMGSGLVALFIQNLSRKSYVDILEIFVIFSAMILNSSRTGIFALFCIIGYVMVMQVKSKLSFKTILIFAVLTIVAFIGLDYLMSSRENLESFTDENGREVTFINGLNIWLDNPRNFLFGEGFTGGMWEGITKTHNFVIQTLAQNGLIVASIIFSFIIVFIKKTFGTPFKYMVWFIILSGLLVTDFYANAFTSIAFILVCLHSRQPDSIGSVKFKNIL